MENKILEELNLKIEEVAQKFLEKYFYEDGELLGDAWFVEHKDEDLKFNLYVNDYYFNIDDIFTALYYDIPQDILFDWYDKGLEYSMNRKPFVKNKKELDPFPNLKNFYLINKNQGKN